MIKLTTLVGCHSEDVCRSLTHDELRDMIKEAIQEANEAQSVKGDDNPKWSPIGGQAELDMRKLGRLIVNLEDWLDEANRISSLRKAEAELEPIRSVLSRLKAMQQDLGAESSKTASQTKERKWKEKEESERGTIAWEKPE